MRPREIVEHGYDIIYKTYHDQRNVWQNKKELKDFIKHLPKRSKVLDVGCGSGYVAKFLNSKKLSVVGIDVSKNMLKLAKKNVPTAKFAKMDMTNLEFPNESFEGIVCLYSIIHVPRKFHFKILGKFHKTLKSDGFLLISVGLGDTKEGVEENWLGAKMYWSHFNKETNLKLIKKIGFEIIWSRVIGPRNDKHLFVLAEKI